MLAIQAMSQGIHQSVGGIEPLIFPKVIGGYIKKL
jgi:hypothetical protein